MKKIILATLFSLFALNNFAQKKADKHKIVFQFTNAQDTLQQKAFAKQLENITQHWPKAKYEVVLYNMGLEFVMTSKSKAVKFLSFMYIESIRIIPILVWLFIVYFGLAKLINIHLSSVVVSIIVFSFWGIAEMGDLVRGAITSIPKSQKEAGLAIGLSKIELMI